MKHLGYYIAYPFLWLLASLPFRGIYLVSDFLYFVVYKIIGYRKKVVFENLANAFPDKSVAEHKAIASKYYAYLCDLIVETIKTIKITEQEVKAHMTVSNPAFFDAIYDQNKSVILTLGHWGNWELAGPIFSLTCKHQLNVIYKPLSQEKFEELFTKARTKFTTKITPMKNTLRVMTGLRKQLTATAFAADQTPSSPDQGHWVNFLNQETLVFMGPEKIAKMLDFPVVYLKIDRIKRGQYVVTGEMLEADPKATPDFDITERFNKRLEEDIVRKPEIWLWSHRRWKHKRKTNN